MLSCRSGLPLQDLEPSYLECIFSREQRAREIIFDEGIVSFFD